MNPQGIKQRQGLQARLQNQPIDSPIFEAKKNRPEPVGCLFFHYA
jgi:hypothetical protein